MDCLNMINCHVMEASGRLERFKDRLEVTTTLAVKEIVGLLPVSAVDVVYYVNPLGTIPEVGVCGYTPTANIIFMSLDPENPALERSFEEEIPATLAHELHHCMRWRGPGYGRTLLEVLVTEGLARDFEIKFRTGKMPQYHGALSSTQVCELLERMREEFTSTTFSYSEWFYGSTARSIPASAGYLLGHHLVREYLMKTGKSSAALWNEPASAFVEL